MTTTNNPTFVFIHGAWHNHHTWDKVVAALSERGYGSVAIDLPGAGPNAQSPAAFNERPLDPAKFATEPSPNAGVTQAERNDATIAAVQQATQMGNGRVVLVGHSLGGLTISPVAEMIPEQIHAVVYLTAFMLPHGMVAGQVIGSEIMAKAKVPPLFMADPEAVGALRMDVGSTDSSYLAAVKEAFYADVSDEDFQFILSHLHCDEPAQVAGTPSIITQEKYGTVNRHYIRCLQDQAIVIEGQDHMIELVDADMGNVTQTHTLDTSHSPFLSAVEPLVDVLVSCG